MSGRLLVANLDAETRLAGQSLSRAALATASALGTLLRAFAAPGDVLWTPAPVDPERLPELPELRRPELVSGSLEGLSEKLRGRPVLAWAWTGRLEPPAAPASPREEEGVGGLGDLLWSCGAPEPDVVERVLDRRFGLEVARSLGEALPGARWVGSVEGLEEHLGDGGAAASPTGSWVVKAPCSAAGRSRYVGHRQGDQGVAAVAEALSREPDKRVAPVRGELSGTARRRVRRLLERHGGLFFEPWMDRVADFGVTGVVIGGKDDGTPAALAWHSLEVDEGGRFRAIRVPGEVTGTRSEVPGTLAGEVSGTSGKVPGTPSVEGVGIAGSEVSGTLLAVAREVGRALAKAGYRGPFGVDSYLHRDVRGELRLQALGEVNARMTYGHVARALAERFGPGELRVGRSAPEGREPATKGASAEEPVAELLTPGEDGSPGAWWIRRVAP